MSDGAIAPGWRRLIFSLLDFRVLLCEDLALPRASVPELRFLNRFAAPLCVFIFGTTNPFPFVCAPPAIPAFGGVAVPLGSLVLTLRGPRGDNPGPPLLECAIGPNQRPERPPTWAP